MFIYSKVELFGGGGSLRIDEGSMRFKRFITHRLAKKIIEFCWSLGLLLLAETCYSFSKLMTHCVTHEFGLLR